MLEDLLFSGVFEDGFGAIVRWLESLIPLILIGSEG